MAVGVHNGTASLRMRLLPSPPVASTATAIVASALHRATAGPSRCGRTAEVFALASLRRRSLSRLRFDLPALSNSGSRYGGYSGGYSVVTDLRRLLKRHRLLDARHHHNRHPGRGERLVYLSLGRCQLSGARRFRTILDFETTDLVPNSESRLNRMLPLNHRTSRRWSSAPILIAADCCMSGRSLEYLPDERGWHGRSHS